MKKLLKILPVLIFSILVLIIGNVVWSFFNPYAQVLLIPLAFLNIYYLLLFLFTKLLAHNESKIWYYLIVAMLVLPLLSVSIAYDTFIRLSVTILNTIIK